MGVLNHTSQQNLSKVKSIVRNRALLLIDAISALFSGNFTEASKKFGEAVSTNGDDFTKATDAARVYIEALEDLEDRISVLLVCRETKQVFTMVGNNFISVKGEAHAIGSGAHVATGAMLVGATSKEAVKAAAKVDLNTGGKIVTAKV